MRHRLFLISIGAPTLSLKGMAKCPWRKGKAWPLKVVGVIEPHPVHGDHSGNHPDGKKKKRDRIKSGPPGSPNGICIHQTHPDLCFCGKHGGRK